MKSKLLTFFFLFAIAIQMIPVLEIAKYFNDANIQEEQCYSAMDDEDETIEKSTSVKKNDIGIFNWAHLHLNDSFQIRKRYIFDTIAFHQFFAKTPTRPPLTSC